MWRWGEGKLSFRDGFKGVRIFSPFHLTGFQYEFEWSWCKQWCSVSFERTAPFIKRCIYLWMTCHILCQVAVPQATKDKNYRMNINATVLFDVEQPSFASRQYIVAGLSSRCNARFVICAKTWVRSRRCVIWHHSPHTSSISFISHYGCGTTVILFLFRTMKQVVLCEWVGSHCYTATCTMHSSCEIGRWNESNTQHGTLKWYYSFQSQPRRQNHVIG